MFVSHSLYIIYSWRPLVTMNQMPSEPYHWQLITMTVKKCFPDVQLYQKENCFLSSENTWSVICALNCDRGKARR